jgi:hypothetical protein
MISPCYRFQIFSLCAVFSLFLQALKKHKHDDKDYIAGWFGERI